VLRGGLLVGTGVATVGAMSAVLTRTAKAETPQSGWGYCTLCTSMWWTAGKSGSHCAYDTVTQSNGQHASGSGGYDYGLYYNLTGLVNTSNPQPKWRFCTACQGLFFGGNGGRCAALGWAGTPGAHVAGGTSYDLYWGGSPGQSDWHYCGNCSLLYFTQASDGVAGWCPWGIGVMGTNGARNGEPHQLGSNTNYDIGHS
jgi:hypothetical protein